mgnify:CR=1 FL=1
MNKFLLTLFLALCVSACTPYALKTWQHSNKGESQFYADKLACERQAQEIAPDATRQVEKRVRDDTVTGYETKCRDGYNGDVVCESVPQRNIYATKKVVVQETQDNGYRRWSLRDDCLRSKGWVHQ